MIQHIELKKRFYLENINVDQHIDSVVGEFEDYLYSKGIICLFRSIVRGYHTHEDGNMGAFLTNVNVAGFIDATFLLNSFYPDLINEINDRYGDPPITVDIQLQFMNDEGKDSEIDLGCISPNFKFKKIAREIYVEEDWVMDGSEGNPYISERDAILNSVPGDVVVIKKRNVRLREYCVTEEMIQNLKQMNGCRPKRLMLMLSKKGG